MVAAPFALLALVAVAAAPGLPVDGSWFDPMKPWWRDKDVFQLAASILLSAATASVAFLLARYNMRIDRTKAINQELVKKRLAIYDQVVPNVNDIYCFIKFIGGWANFTPADIVRKKRDCDRHMHVYRALLSHQVFNTYQVLIEACFRHYSGSGTAARIRIDHNRVATEWGPRWLAEWYAAVTDEPASVAALDRAYAAFVDSFACEIGVRPEAGPLQATRMFDAGPRSPPIHDPRSQARLP